MLHRGIVGATAGPIAFPAQFIEKMADLDRFKGDLALTGIGKNAPFPPLAPSGALTGFHRAIHKPVYIKNQTRGFYSK